MPKIDIAKAAIGAAIASYPQPFAPVISGREEQRLGNAAGLTQFGVNLTRIKPGSASALRHWHEQEDEFIYMLEGELVLRGRRRDRAAAGRRRRLQGRQRIGHAWSTARARRGLSRGRHACRERVHYPDVDS